jgi:voltage-gated potassium channel Kch
MKKIDTTRVLLIYVGLLLFFISYGLLVFSGIDPRLALIWNILSSLEVNFQLLPINYATIPAVPIAGVIDAFVFAILAAAFATVFFDAIKQLRMNRMLALSKIKKLSNHVILAPANTFSEYLSTELNKIGVDNVIMAEKEHDAFRLARRKHLAIIGNPKSEEAFSAAGVEKAIYVIACDEDDVQNALMTVTAKSVNPKVRVVSRITDIDSIPKMGMVGVYRTIMPEITTGVAIGNEIAKSMSNPKSAQK